MWLSKKEKQTFTGCDASIGPVTLAGDPAAAFLGGERRNLTVYAPGGYHWMPDRDQEVLVLKAGIQGEYPCAIGTKSCGTDWNLQPGEVLLTAGKTSVHLHTNGTVSIQGSLFVNGRRVLTDTGGNVEPEQEDT